METSTGRIDFVLPWVDGSDPEWIALKRKYELSESDIAGGDANGECRYRDFGLLKYWFRAVERFTPWVGKVFFVTCGQKPDWLNLSNPKLRFVSHRDYIPQEYLPTFHSDTIELNLHRIPDLSERFVLFNDDIFLLRPLRPECFFKNGMPRISCDLGIPTWLGCSTISRVALNNGGVLRRSMDVNRLVWKNIAKFVDLRALGPVRAMKNVVSFAVNRVVIPGTFGHLACPHLKSTLDEIWRVQPRIMDATSRSRFRIDTGVSQWLASAWNMVSGNFYPTNEKRNGMLLTIDDKNISLICDAIRRQKWPQICLFDNVDCPDIEVCFAKIASALDALLPEKSSFEK